MMTHSLKTGVASSSPEIDHLEFFGPWT